MFLSLLYQEKTTKNYQNFLAKGLKDQFIGMNIKQNVKIKFRQMNINSFSNQSLGDCNWTRTNNHLVHKRTLNHLAKMVECSFMN